MEALDPKDHGAWRRGGECMTLKKKGTKSLSQTGVTCTSGLSLIAWWAGNLSSGMILACSSVRTLCLALRALGSKQHGEGGWWGGVWPLRTGSSSLRAGLECGCQATAINIQ